MRIAYLVPCYPVATFVTNEMREVEAAGHEVIIVPLRPHRTAPSCETTIGRLQNAKVLPAAILDAQVIGFAFLALLAYPFRAIKVVLSLHLAAGLNVYAQAALLAVIPKALATAWRLRNLAVDRIHAHFATHTATCAAIAGATIRTPFSFTAHAYDIYCTTAKLRNDTLAWKLRHAVQSFGENEHGANLLRGMLRPEQQDRVHRAYNGVHLDLFQEQPPRPNVGIIHLLCVARLCRKKGIDVLIDACGILRDRGVAFDLSVCGDGPLRDELSAQVSGKRLERHVTLCGPISQEAVAQKTQSCHVFVMPCRVDENGDMDGIPTVFMEAMATGRPVVSCAVAGVPELVRDGETGLLVPCDDPEAVATAVQRLAEDDALRLRLGREARALVESQHDQRRNTRRLLHLMGHATTSASPAMQPSSEPSSNSVASTKTA
jgi:colanic acid/amylovoran biosynthesis glycosyltransferase